PPPGAAKPPADVKPADPAKPAKPADTGKPAAPAPAAPADPKPAPMSRDARIRELESKVEKLTKAMADMKAPAPAAAAVPVAPPPPPPEPDKGLEPLRGIVVSGYVQAQLENHDDSEDQLRPGGALYNQNRFLIRRGRIKIEREWDYSSVLLEFDGNTNKGPQFQLFRAEAALQYRGSNPAPAPALVKLSMGLFDVPFGYELSESSKTRFFMERSLQSRAFFPSEPDLGFRVSGQLGWFRYALAAMNGNPLGDVTFAAQDPNNHKDFVARIGAFVSPAKSLDISGGVSVLNGKGFAKGTDATKNILVWTDKNEDRAFTSGEINGSAAFPASPSYNFDRWAVGADLQVRFDTPLGTSKVYGELQLGSNMDRALFIANPTLGGQPARELGYYLGVVQDVTRYGVVGFRTELYDPNADFLGYQSGKAIPASQAIRIQSPMVGVVIPGRARLLFQYDFVRDHLGRNVSGAPIDMKNDQWTLRLQGDL
ncbi:MAG TPA: hypothetical protein VJT73_06475, partial [Polyangiaceae bacterium]|nr:hypothetical protein [Polyangiaceae bacterium]